MLKLIKKHPLLFNIDYIKYYRCFHLYWKNVLFYTLTINYSYGLLSITSQDLREHGTIGGISAHQSIDGTITSSYSSVYIDAQFGGSSAYHGILTIGGNVGHNKGYISDSYSTGMVRFSLSVTPSRSSIYARYKPTQAKLSMGGFVGIH